MGVSGMTGFGRAEGSAPNLHWIWEARSVNGRGLDVKVRLPNGYDALEPIVRDAAKTRFRRGSLQIGLSVRSDAVETGLHINTAFIQAAVAAGAIYVREGLVAPPRWDGLLALRGALVAEQAVEISDEARLAAVRGGLDEAIDALSAARADEGKSLARIMTALLDDIARAATHARTLAVAQPEAFAARLRATVAALAADAGLDPQRLTAEAALLATKADIREELDRLDAHVAEARALIAAPEPAGRRLDFLSQELNREANTLCSKSSDLALTRLGLDLKTAIDQFREQSANVE